MVKNQKRKEKGLYRQQRKNENRDLNYHGKVIPPFTKKEREAMHSPFSVY